MAQVALVATLLGPCTRHMLVPDAHHRAISLYKCRCQTPLPHRRPLNHVLLHQYRSTAFDLGHGHALTLLPSASPSHFHSACHYFSLSLGVGILLVPPGFGGPAMRCD